VATVPIRVLVHTFVAGLQELPPQTDSFAGAQATHAPLPDVAEVNLQIDLPGIWLQSALSAHPVHVPAIQTEAAAFVQSALLRHCTHSSAVVSQYGLPVPAQSGSFLHEPLPLSFFSAPELSQDAV
jgi:hypothetical protein